MFKSITKSVYSNSKRFFVPFQTHIYQSTQLFKTVQKNFVSGNPQSKVNRENRELDKIEKFWDKVEKDEIRRRGLESEVEKRYSDPVIKLGKEEDKKSLEFYYIPLSNEDSKLLEHFSNEAAEMIKNGGKLTLINEINFFNKSQPLEKQIKLDSNFEPLSLKEVEEFKKEFKEIFEKEEIFNFVLQKGRSLYNSLKSLKEDILLEYVNLSGKLSYLENYNEVMTSIPFNTKINANFEKQEDPHYVKLFLDNVKFNEAETTNKLKEIYLNYYKAIVESYKEKKETKNKENAEEKSGLNLIENQIELNLLNRTHIYLDYLINHGMKVDFIKDTSKTDLVEESYIFEKIFIKGVSVDRSENYEPDEYVLIDSHENLGIRYFLHKGLIGERVKMDQDYNPILNGSKTSDPEYLNSLNYKLVQKNRKIVLRAYLFIKHPFKLVTEKLEYPADYSFNHLAVFENEIVPPHHLTLIDSDFVKYLKKHKINLSDWKLVDVDNFMKGNPFFIPKSPILSCHETFTNTEATIQSFIKETFGITEFKNELKSKEQEKLKQAEVPAKKDKKKKDKKEENVKEQEVSTKDIPNLKFNYNIIKLNRPVNKVIGSIEENAEIIKEIEKHNKKQLAKNDSKIKENLEKLQQFEKELEEFGSVEKLDSLVKQNNKLKKEIKKLEYEEIILNPFYNRKDSNGQINKVPPTDLDKLVNKLLVNCVKKFIEKKEEVF